MVDQLSNTHPVAIRHGRRAPQTDMESVELFFIGLGDSIMDGWQSLRSWFAEMYDMFACFSDYLGEEIDINATLGRGKRDTLLMEDPSQ